MSQIDRLIRRRLKDALHLPISVCTEFFYQTVNAGGLNIKRLYDIVDFAKVRLHGSNIKSDDKCLEHLVLTLGSSMNSRWTNGMKLGNNDIAAEIKSAKVQRINEGRERLARTVHGGGIEVFEQSALTNRWLGGYTRIMNGRTFVRAIQLRTNTIPTAVTCTRDQNSNKTCRRCGLADETLQHILSFCPKTQGMRCRRHNNVCKKVAEKLRSEGFQVYSEQGIPSPGLQTAISRPDIIATKGQLAYVLDVTCVYETKADCLQKAYTRKVDRYKPLEAAIKQKYAIDKVTFHGLVIGTRGAIDPRHLTYWRAIGFTCSDLQTIVVGVIEDSLRTITLFNNRNKLDM